MEQHLKYFHDRNFPLFFVITFLTSVVPTIVLFPLFEAPDLKNGQLSALGDLFPVFIVLIAPAVETLLMQWFPAFLFDIFPVRSATRIALITMPFALGHIVPTLVIPSLINGMTGGAILGTFYLVCRNKTHYHAIAATFAIHAGHNAVALGIGG